MKQTKRILSIELKRIDDTDPDTSYLGEYTHNPVGEFYIDRTHEGDCSVNLGGEVCTCDMRHLAPNEYEFFNPGSIEPFDAKADWMPTGVKASLRHDYWEKTMRENARKNYERMEACTRGDWSFIGIRAQAEVVVDGVCQSITSGGLWGIESDSEESYLSSVEEEELTSLRGILHELGFSKRAIATAVYDM